MMFKFIKRVLMLVVLVFGVLIAIFIGFLTTIDIPEMTDGRVPTRQKPKAAVMTKNHAAPKLLSHKIASDEPTDTPRKTQIELRIVVNQKPTENELRALLRSLFDDVMKRRGFKFRSHPNAVYIYAFAPKQVPKGPSRIGTLMLKPSDAKPAVRVDSARIDLLYTDEPELKFGLTKRQRKRVFREWVEAEDQAEHKAAKLYPVPNIGSSGYTEADAKTVWRKQRRKFEELHGIYRKRVLRKYELTEEKALQISLEAHLKNWPMPVLPSPGP